MTMKKLLLSTIIGLAQAIGLPGAQAAQIAPLPLPVQPNPQPIQPAATQARKTVSDGSFLGKAFDAYYGYVQVQANIKSGRLVSVDVVQFPNHTRTSKLINNQALPMLETMVVQAQTTRVNAVSGATLTSDAYLKSLRSAILQAAS
jgi:uncharacterized protein with FMN-binding domain